MKLEIHSDTHSDMWERVNRPLTYNDSDGDVILFAGDAGNGESEYKKHLAVLQQTDKDIISVRGNHDFYGGDVINNKMIHDIQGLKILTCTLFSQCGYSMGDEGLITHNIADFHPIYGIDNYSVGEHSKLYKDNVEFILDNDADVVMTHFAPCQGSIHPIYYGNRLNIYFVNNLDSYVQESNIKLWVHGHVHNKFDYMCGSTRIVANPHGYPGENGWDQTINPMVIEI